MKNLATAALLAALGLGLASCSGGGGTGDDSVTGDVADDAGGDAAVDQSGVCTADEQCADDDPCTDDKCEEGVCKNPPRICNDGLYCNGTEKCDPDTGECIQDAPIILDDGVLCTIDECNEETDEILHKPDNAGCQDDNPCTDNVCDAVGGCMQQNNKAACDDGDPCTENDKCGDGSCSGLPKVCDDGEFCNGVETCDAGTGDCLDGTAPDIDDGVDCTTDKCDETKDEVVHEPDAAACDDSNPCTDDVCDPVDGCSNPNNEAECDDSDPCTVDDVCSEGSCAGTAKVCSDGLFCNGLETCDAQTGDCQAGDAPGLDDGVDCTVDSCSDDTAEVLHTPDPAACDDSNPCTDDVCDPIAGCLHPANALLCDDSDPCTVDDVCAEGKCAGVPKVCSDGLYCNGEETCKADTGECIPGETPSVDDGVECTIDSCDEDKNGAVHELDHEFCKDENPCTDTTCDAVAGCLLVNNQELCDDSDPCTVDDVCAEGKCAGVPKVCSDGLYCNGMETCKPDTGECLPGEAPIIDDEVNCTVDSCDEENDKVVNSPDDLLCTDQNACTDDVCDPIGGCNLTHNTSACDDLDKCTYDDVCADGQCKGTVKICDDGKFCNGLETCSGATGFCVDGTPPIVDDKVGCTVDSCDEVGDVVKHVPDHASCNKGNLCADYSCDPVKDCQEIANTKPCDDQEACTEGDACDSFQCKPGKWVCEDCSNQEDDNGDGKIDCCDPLCSKGEGCGSESQCSNSFDDDCDLAPDCLDEDCLGDEACGPYPQYGDILVTEVMQNPGAVDDSKGEWFEVVNVTDQTFNLAFLEVSDIGGEHFQVPVNLSIGPGEYLLFANNGDEQTNGQVQADFIYAGFSLANQTDEIVLVLNGETLDELVYDGTDAFPAPSGASMQLDPDYTSADDNDDGNNWCTSVAPWAQDQSGDFGTPGMANYYCMEYDCGDNNDNDMDGKTDCDDPDCTGDQACTDSDNDGVYDPQDLCPGGNDKVDNDNDALPDACEIGWVGGIWPNNGTSVDNKQDLTVYIQIFKEGVTNLGGQGAKVKASVKYKMMDGQGYVSAAMDYNKDIGNNDEYKAVIPASFTVAGGTLSVDFEVRFDVGVEGVDYVYNNGPMKDQGGMPAPMQYPISAVPEPPVPGDIVIDEIMFNPSKVNDDKGEWFEVYNKSDKMLDFKGVKVASNNDTGHAIGVSVLLAPYKYLVLGNNGVVSTNGGVKVDYAYPSSTGSGVVLANGTDAVWLEHSGQTLDKVAYGTGFPAPNGASMVLHQDYFDPGQNDVGNVWCTAKTPYGLGDLGTPGAKNDTCGP